MPYPSIPHYSFRQDVELGFEILELEDIYRRHAPAMTIPHRVNFYQILWFRGGSTYHMVDFQSIPTPPDTLLFVHKDMVTRFENTAGIQGTTLIFIDSFFGRDDIDLQFLNQSLCFNTFTQPARIPQCSMFPGFARYVQLMREELAQTPDGFRANIIHNLLHNFLLEAERVLRQQDVFQKPAGIDWEYAVAFREMLEREFKSEKRIRNYAAQLHLTENRLYLATLAAFGKSPKQLLDERVLLEAKRLLAHTSQPVKTIGLELGFEEATHFNKFFRKLVQLTPVEFRKQQQ